MGLKRVLIPLSTKTYSIYSSTMTSSTLSLK